MKIRLKYPNIFSKLLIAYFLLITINGCKRLEINRELLVRADSVFNIRTHDAIARATIEDVGNGIISYGHVWDTLAGISISSNRTENNNLPETGNFDSQITGLKPGKLYYIKPYVFDGINYIFGELQSFRTLAYSVPTVETDSVISQSTFSVTIQGKITDLGPDGDQVLQYGHCYSTLPYPVVGDSTSRFGPAYTITTFNSKLSVFPGNWYHIRAYAINEFDTVYGQDVKINIADITPILNIAIEYSSVTDSNAMVSINIDNNKGANITQFGLCYGETIHPRIANSDYNSYAAIDDPYYYLTLEAFNLLPDTRYYVRGYVKSNIGFTYSNEESFTTKKAN